MTIPGLALAAVLALLAAAPPAPETETIWIPMTERSPRGEPRALRLEATLYRSSRGPGSPVLIFNHGSTGGGQIAPTLTRTYPELGRHFAGRGFTVLMPMRRGRGASGGDYLERYGCDHDTLAPGVARGIEDLDAVMAFVAGQPWFDRARFVLGGQSRGGLLSVVYASARDTGARGVLNFAGGWVNGACNQRIRFHEHMFARAGGSAGPPGLWLYSENDPLYGPDSVRGSHAAFVRAGGVADLQILPPLSPDGHLGLPRTPVAWERMVDEFLGRLGL